MDGRAGGRAGGGRADGRAGGRAGGRADGRPYWAPPPPTKKSFRFVPCVRVVRAKLCAGVRRVDSEARVGAANISCSFALGNGTQDLLPFVLKGEADPRSCVPFPGMQIRVPFPEFDVSSIVSF